MEPAFPRVLVVHDEVAVRELLVYGLGRQGFDVRCASDGPAALDIVNAWLPEAIVLDVMLLDVEGVSMLAAVRLASEAPIIMLTAGAETSDRVATLTVPADDYLSKPFEMEELVARLRAALRRPRLRMREMLSYADLSIDVSRRTVARAARRIALTTREFELLLTLAREPERIFTRTELLELVWGTDCETAPATVEMSIAHLQAKIDVDDGVRLIHAVGAAGYALRRASVPAAN